MSFLVIGLVSCGAKKELSQAVDTPIASLERGPLVYLTKQDINKADCTFHQLNGDDLVMSIMKNHTGNKDDRVPARVVSTDGTIIHSPRSETHTNRVVTKSCFNPQGHIVAMEFDTRDNPALTEVLKEALFKIRFEANESRACVECMTKYYWVR